MEFLSSSGKELILAIFIILVIKIFIFYSTRTRFWTFSQFFFFSLENIELTHGRRYFIKLVNNILTCSVIFIVFSFIMLFYLDVPTAAAVNSFVTEASIEPVTESNSEIFTTTQINNSETNIMAGKSSETDRLEDAHFSNSDGTKIMNVKAEKVNNKKAIRPTNSTRIETTQIVVNSKAIGKPLRLITKRNFSSVEMFSILNLLKAKRKQLSNNSNCIRIIKSKTSNIENAFHLARFFQKQGFVIAGREERFLEEKGIRIDVRGSILKIIIGRI